MCLACPQYYNEKDEFTKSMYHIISKLVLKKKKRDKKPNMPRLKIKPHSDKTTDWKDSEKKKKSDTSY